MTGLRNACKIYIFLIFVTCAMTSNGYKPILRNGPNGSNSSTSSEESGEMKPVIRERDDSESDTITSDEDGPESGPKSTKGIMRDQALDGDVSSEKRKKRDAIIYRTGEPLRREK